MKNIKRKILTSIVMIFSAAVILTVTISLAWLAMENDGFTQYFGSGGLSVTLNPKYNTATGAYNATYLNPSYKYLPGDELVSTNHYEESRGEENKPDFNLSFSYECNNVCVIRVSVTYTYEGQGEDPEPESAGILNVRDDDIMDNKVTYVVPDDEPALLAVYLSDNFYPVKEAAAPGEVPDCYWYYTTDTGPVKTNTPVNGSGTLTNIFECFALNGEKIFAETIIVDGETITVETGRISFTVTVSMRQLNPTSAVNWNNYNATVKMGGAFARS